MVVSKWNSPFRFLTCSSTAGSALEGGRRCSRASTTREVNS